MESMKDQTPTGGRSSLDRQLSSGSGVVALRRLDTSTVRGFQGGISLRREKVKGDFDVYPREEREFFLLLLFLRAETAPTRREAEAEWRDETGGNVHATTPTDFAFALKWRESAEGLSKCFLMYHVCV